MSTVAAAPVSPQRGVASLVGVLAVAAAVAVGQLVAALVSPMSAPLVAVADAVVRLAPPWLVELGKSLGPETDKLVLQVGVALAVVVLGALAGLLARPDVRRGVAVIAVLGLVGGLAVMSSPAFAPLDLLAPAAALVAGVVVFRRLHGTAAHGGEPDTSRRSLLIGASAAVGMLALVAGGVTALVGRGVGGSRGDVSARLSGARLAERAPSVPAGAAFPELGTPTFLTRNADFYRIDTALRTPTLAADGWSLRIHGMVERETTLTFADLMARPLVERAVTLACVSNEVGGDLISTANFVGVDLRALLLEAGVRQDAEQLFTTSVDGWTCGTPVDVVMEEDRGAMLAVGMNGEALPPEHGFPVRMVVPGLYGFVSATKWITDMEVTTFDRQQAYWLQRGWAQEAPIKTQSRIDAPRDLATVAAGRVVAAGIAWAQHVGVDRVEVRVDGGPWQQAVLADDVSRDTWRMWRAEMDLGPGTHEIQSRATDRAGRTQTETPAPPAPDGATGWHTITVTAT